MQKKILNTTVYASLILLSIVFLYPIFNMFVISLFTETDISAFPPRWLPSNPQWNNYLDALSFSGSIDGLPALIVYLKNTLIVILGCGIGVIVSASMCAYGFSKIKFPGREILFFLILTTMMIPGVVTMIPLFVVYKNFHWLNTLYPLWVPAFFGGGALTIFLLRQFMRTIPDTICESARIDGAGHFKIYSQIILPNCIPILIVVLINTITGVWNDFMGPLIYINQQSKWTLALGVANILQTNEYGVASKAPIMMAACVLMSILPLILFYVGQKFFIENVTMTGIKG